MIDDLVLGFFTVAALAGALLMLVLRHPMRVALALVATMLSLAGVYAMLGAHAIAVFQVLIYVGAVMVFMVYVIMLLDLGEESSHGRYSWMLVPGVVGFLILVATLGGDIWTSLGVQTDPARQIGVAPFAIVFLYDYWLHFELVSVLLVAAVVAALAVIELGRKPHG
jgi:NADH-quinone oxidoreductase subunit J